MEVGAVELFPDVYSGRRWIHWEAAAGRVCLKEIWLDHDLIDHTICLQLGGNLVSLSNRDNIMHNLFLFLKYFYFLL